MECTCVYLSVLVGRRGEWWVGVVARSEEYKCIYMFGGESGKLLQVAKAKEPGD